MQKEYLNILKNIARKHIPEKEYIIFMFGSRAYKNNHDRSDIDLGIWGIKPLPAIIRADLELEIQESRIPYFVDIVDFSRVTDDFKKEAFRNVELWNYPKNLKATLKI